MTAARKQLVLSRYKILRKRLELKGAQIALASVGANSCTITLVSNQDVSDVVEWAFLEWADVASVIQAQDDQARYFTLTFQPAKDDFDDSPEAD